MHQSGWYTHGHAARLIRDIAAFVLVLMLALAPHMSIVPAVHAAGATLYVGSTADTTSMANQATCSVSTNTTCTLRDAITVANATSTVIAPVTIQFAIPANTDAGCVMATGVCTITPAFALPVITAPVTINGYSQSGASANTSAMGSNAVLKIEINGAVATIAMNETGLYFSTGATGSTVRGLVINRYTIGIALFVQNATVAGNFIGTNVAGTAALGNTTAGVSITSTARNNTVGGTAAADRNVISGNGIGVTFPQDVNSYTNTVAGNLIGTNAAGTAAIGNTTGVRIESPQMTIGGATAGAGNVISGNATGILVTGSVSGSETITGNFIGTNAAGTAAIGNTNEGISLESSNANTVGGTTASARNVISGNTTGVAVGGAPGGDLVTGNAITGNYIGTNATGTAAIGNRSGVMTTFANSTMIGGTTAGAGNLISGNQDGIIISSDSIATVAGNLIGTNATGTAAIGNTTTGIYINSSGAHGTIGGTTATARNVISGNADGIVIFGIPGFMFATSSGTITGNYIGTDVTGTAPLGNTGNGIWVHDASQTIIGGTDPGAGNIIANNGGRGVVIGFDVTDTYAFSNRVLGNVITANGNIGIDLGNDGITANTPGGPHVGPNELQNYPVLTVANGTAVSGTLNSVASTMFRIELFSNPTAVRQGQTLIGTATVTTDGMGNGSFTATVPTLAAGQFITATATNLIMDETSEFAAPLAVFTLAAVSPASGDVRGGNLVTITGTGFTGGASVLVDGVSVTPTSVTPTSITFIAPAHMTGTVSIGVTVSGQTMTKANAYTYGVVNATPQPQTTRPAVGIPLPNVATHAAGPGVGAGTPTPPPQPVRHAG